MFFKSDLLLLSNLIVINFLNCYYNILAIGDTLSHNIRYPTHTLLWTYNYG